MFDYEKTTALITGASSGLGERFAEALARRGAKVALVARSADRLEALAARLRAAHGTEASVIIADLSQPSAPAEVFAAAQAHGLKVNLLVNNAGFALGGPFLEHEIEREQDLVAVNVTALTVLAHLFGAGMPAFGANAGIINVASTAAFQPLPYAATYAAAKAYVLSFGGALGRELRRQGPHVLTVCPGPVATPFWDKLGSKFPLALMDSPDRIVAQSLAAFEARRAVVIPGRWLNRLSPFLARFVSRGTVLRMAEFGSRKIMMAGQRRPARG